MQRSAGCLASLVGLLTMVVVVYLTIGVFFWLERLATDSFREPPCAGTETSEADQLLGFEPGLLRIVLWGPELYRAVEQDLPLEELVWPTACLPGGSVSYSSERCTCSYTPQSDNPALQRLITLCSQTLSYWVEPGQSCQAARPAICCAE